MKMTRGALAEARGNSGQLLVTVAPRQLVVLLQRLRLPVDLRLCLVCWRVWAPVRSDLLLHSDPNLTESPVLQGRLTCIFQDTKTGHERRMGSTGSPGVELNSLGL